MRRRNKRMAGLLSRLGRKKSVHIWSAVVVAAGSARRMEGIDKVLTTLGELPVLVHTLRVFQQCPDIAEIIVVTRADLMAEVGSICQDFALTKVRKVIKGGAERIHSVQAGVNEVREDAELIAIHDGARPLLPPGVLEEVLPRAAPTGAAAPAVPLTHTVKRSGNGPGGGGGGHPAKWRKRRTLGPRKTDRTSAYPRRMPSGVISASTDKSFRRKTPRATIWPSIRWDGLSWSTTHGSSG